MSLHGFLKNEGSFYHGTRGVSTDILPYYPGTLNWNFPVSSDIFFVSLFFCFKKQFF